MASAVSRIGDYAIEKGFTMLSVFEAASVADVRKWWSQLEKIESSLSLILVKTAAFTAAMKHYMDFLNLGEMNAPAKDTPKEAAKGRVPL